MPHSVNKSTSSTMSHPSSTSNSLANAFPRPAGVNLLAPETAAADHLSPSRSTFSFASSNKSTPDIKHNSTGSDDRRSSRGLTQGPGGIQPNGSRRRAQYYEESFAYKDGSTSSARDRVTRDSPVVAELRTNVIIKDEYTLVTDLSHQLSTRYQRPESSIMITVNHSACLLLGGSFEPTYILTITALPTQVQQTTNKRNASLIQTFMFETLGVPMERGIVKFVAVQEHCIATNGVTIFGEIERLERQQAEANGGLKRGLTKSSKRSAISKAKSSLQLNRNTSKTSKADYSASAAISSPIPGHSPLDASVAVDREDADSFLPIDDKPAKKKSVSRKASRIAIIKSKSEVNLIMATAPPAPPVPKDATAPKVSKRKKSMMALFKR